MNKPLSNQQFKMLVDKLKESSSTNSSSVSAKETATMVGGGRAVNEKDLLVNKNLAEIKSTLEKIGSNFVKANEKIASRLDKPDGQKQLTLTEQLKSGVAGVKRFGSALSTTSGAIGGGLRSFAANPLTSLKSMGVRAGKKIADTEIAAENYVSDIFNTPKDYKPGSMLAATKPAERLDKKQKEKTVANLESDNIQSPAETMAEASKQNTSILSELLLTSKDSLNQLKVIKSALTSGPTTGDTSKPSTGAAPAAAKEESSGGGIGSIIGDAIGGRAAAGIGGKLLGGLKAGGAMLGKGALAAGKLVGGALLSKPALIAGGVALAGYGAYKGYQALKNRGVFGKSEEAAQGEAAAGTPADVGKEKTVEQLAMEEAQKFGRKTPNNEDKQAAAMMFRKQALGGKSEGTLSGVSTVPGGKSKDSSVTPWGTMSDQAILERAGQKPVEQAPVSPIVSAPATPAAKATKSTKGPSEELIKKAEFAKQNAINDGAGPEEAEQIYQKMLKYGTVVSAGQGRGDVIQDFIPKGMSGQASAPAESMPTEEGKSFGDRFKGFIDDRNAAFKEKFKGSLLGKAYGALKSRMDAPKDMAGIGGQSDTGAQLPAAPAEKGYKFEKTAFGRFVGSMFSKKEEPKSMAGIGGQSDTGAQLSTAAVQLKSGASTPSSTTAPISSKNMPNWEAQKKSYKDGTPAHHLEKQYPGIEDEFRKLAEKATPKSDSQTSIKILEDVLVTRAIGNMKSKAGAADPTGMGPDSDFKPVDTGSLRQGQQGLKAQHEEMVQAAKPISQQAPSKSLGDRIKGFFGLGKKDDAPATATGTSTAPAAASTKNMPNWEAQKKSYKDSTPAHHLEKQFPGIEDEFRKLAEKATPKSDSQTSIKILEDILVAKAIQNMKGKAKGKVEAGKKDSAKADPTGMGPDSDFKPVDTGSLRQGQQGLKAQQAQIAKDTKPMPAVEQAGDVNAIAASMGIKGKVQGKLEGGVLTAIIDSTGKEHPVEISEKDRAKVEAARKSKALNDRSGKIAQLMKEGKTAEAQALARSPVTGSNLAQTSAENAAMRDEMGKSKAAQPVISTNVQNNNTTSYVPVKSEPRPNTRGSALDNYFNRAAAY